MLKKLLIVAAISAISVTAFASDAARAEAKQVIDLKDGSTAVSYTHLDVYKRQW